MEERKERVRVEVEEEEKEESLCLEGTVSSKTPWGSREGSKGEGELREKRERDKG